MREYGELVEVALNGAQPKAFRWRNRSYRVASVLDHWSERTDWWASEGAPELERTVWRLEASAEGAASRGVFDLTSKASGWVLQRLAD